MANYFRMNCKSKIYCGCTRRQDAQQKPEFEIELIGAVLAYEIARSDGDISDSELSLLIEETKKIALEVNKTY